MPQEDGAVWVLADDRAGNVTQVLGVAEALGRPFTVKQLRYTRLGALPNLIKGAALVGLTEDSRQGLAPPWPRLVIAAGRRTASAARWVKRQSGAFLVQVMDPGPPRDAFDLIAVPTHDRLAPGGNRIGMVGAPHRVTAARLAAEAEAWRPRFAHLPRPWVAVLVGGATHTLPFPEALASDLGEQVAALARAAGGSVLITTSRRTGTAQEEALLAAIPEPRFVHRFGTTGDNPFFGFLGLADAIVVTGDSVSMASEACAAPAPVYIFAPAGAVGPKHARLHAALYARGFARPLEAATPEPWSHPPLNAAEDIAAAIRARMGA